jgi:hypothetical protein
VSAATSARVAPRVRAILSGVAILAIAAPAWIVTHAPAIPHRVRVPLPPKRVVPQAELPPVEPVEFVQLSMDDARAYNDQIPFSTAPNPAARPFRFAGTGDDRARALDCLATAVLYEAGDDTRGERAVAQVVLNRLRHPAFPKTVCGVVFEGSERSTGCQFSFTCDGAVTRWKPSEAGWRRAREVATAALAGSVYKPVGYATHYHTDWVVPYWQSSLVKLAAVGSHLFFRWEGWWGTPPAFNRRQVAGEPAIAQLAAISDAHRTGAALAETDAALAEGAAANGNTTGPLASDPNSFLVTLPAGLIAESFPQLAEQTCGDRPLCKFSAWSDRARTPATLPLEPQQIATMTFSYLRDRSTGYQKALWNCQQIKRNDPTQCMKVQVLMTGAPVAGPAIAAPIETRGPTDLVGVRRAKDAKPVGSAIIAPVSQLAPDRPLVIKPVGRATPVRSAAPGPTSAPKRPRVDRGGPPPTASGKMP